jgi:hypothetical protein
VPLRRSSLRSPRSGGIDLLCVVPYRVSEFVFLDLSALPEVSAAVYASPLLEWTMDAPLATVAKSLGG